MTDTYKMRNPMAMCLALVEPIFKPTQSNVFTGIITDVDR